MVTLADIQKNEDIKALISAGNRYLAAMGFTEHGPRHVSYVSRTAAGILAALHFSPREVELAAIAGWVHDVGNSVNRHDHGPLGAVLLLFDATEQALAERSRREFTANVSHELKTPLQGIIGSAELIENNMVKPEDLPHFAGMLRKEATRLLALIEDIIRLSRLDEGAPMPREQVELNALAKSAVAEQQGPAQQKQVTVTVQGSPVTVNGVRPLLQEVLHNLCENAVKYNVPGGSVTVTTQSTGQNAVITVADTGIGIAPEHQSRVFERFYKSDRSRSAVKDSTGLGLYIANTIVQIHGGTMQVRSEVNRFTEFEFFLPA